MAHGKSKKRVDYHYKEAVCIEAKRRQLASATSAYCRAVDAACTSTSLAWDENVCADFHAAGLLTLRQIGTLWLPGDCGRFGQPAEETLVLAAWDARSDYAIPLPPQVASIK